MQPYRAINCECHDYLELACMRGYILDIELLEAGGIRAKAISLESRADKSEWLILETDGARGAIRLDRIKALTPTSTSAQFGRIVITYEIGQD